MRCIVSLVLLAALCSAASVTDSTNANTCLSINKVCKPNKTPRCCPEFDCLSSGSAHRCIAIPARRDESFLARGAELPCVKLAQKCSPIKHNCCPGGVCTKAGTGYRCLDDAAAGEARGITGDELFVRNSEQATCVKLAQKCQPSKHNCCPGGVCTKAGTGYRCLDD